MATLMQQALDAIRCVQSYGWRPTAQQWADALDQLATFRSVKFLDGAKSREQSNGILSLIWCAIGNAYQELGSVDEAAQAYRTALTFQAGAYFADYYAKLALRHHLSDHYADALRALEDGYSEYLRTPLATRFLGHAISLIHCPRGVWDFWRDTALRGMRRRALRRRLVARPNA